MKSKALVLLCLVLIFQSVGFPAPAMANTDSNPPVTTHILTGNQGINGIYYGQVQVQLSATDESSGVSLTQYSLNNGQSWNTYTEPVLITTMKSYTLLYRSIDGSNNTEAPKSVRFTLKQDSTTPSTTFQLTGTLGKNSYYVSPVQVTLNAQDNQSGIDYTEYSLNLGQSWQRYVGPVLIENSDNSLLYYRSKDKSGNTEKTKKAKIYLDLLPPAEPTITLDNRDWSYGSKTVKIIDGIDQNSGAQKSQYRFSEADPWIDYEAPIVVNGPKVIYAQTIDMAGNISESASASSFIDTTPPSSPVIELSYADWASEDIRAWISSGEDVESQLQRYEYQFGEDGDWIEYGGPITIDSIGITTVSARSVNHAGLPSDVSTIEIKIDKEAPTTPELTLSTEDWTNNPVEVDIIPGTDAISGVRAIEYKLDEGEWQDFTGELSITNEGETHISARTVDMAYNYSEVVEAVAKYDHKAPISTAAVDGNKFNEWYNTDVKVTLTANDTYSGVDKIFYSVNGQTPVSYNIPISIDQDGTYEIRYYSIDIVGNIEDEKTLVIKLDKTEPSTPIIRVDRDLASWIGGDPVGLKQTTGTVTLISDENSENGSPILQYQFGDDGSWINYSAPFPIDVNNIVSLDIKARAVDQAGNISNTYSVKVGAYRVRPYNGHQLYLLGPGGATVIRSGSPWNDGWSYTHLGPITYSTENQRVVVSYTEYKYDENDYSSGTYYSGTVSFHASLIQTVDVQLDNEAPSIPIELSIVSQTQSTVQIKWKPSTDNVGVVGYDVLMGGVKVGSTNDSTYTINNLAINSINRITVRAKDAAGNLSTDSRAIKVSTFVDQQPPTAPMQLVEVNKTDSTVTFSWVASTDNIGIREYEVFIGSELYGSATENTIVLNHLMPSTEYLLTVRAKDLGDNVSPSSEVLSVTTLADLTPPSEPSDLSITNRTESSITLNWKPSIDNVEVYEYEVVQDGVIIGTTTFSNYTVTGLDPYKTYTLEVVAVDVQGNKSRRSMPIKTRNSVQLSVSSQAAYVKADGTVWMWGSDVGSTAQQITELSAVVGVATDGYSTLALKSDGTVWMRNYSGTVQQVAGLEGIISVAAGSSSYYALKDDGTVWAWGSNDRGQLGDGTTMDRTTPVKITSLSGVTAIAASNSPTSTIKFAYALKSDGTVWAWGDNSNYQLGDGTNAQRLNPVQVSGLIDVTAISAGSSHGLALKADGSVWTWGTYTNRTAVSANVTGVTTIAAGNNSNLVLKTDGTVWAWGENGNGQLGDGTTVNRSTPVQVVGLTDVIHVAASGRHTYSSAALKSDGTVWTWGYNGSGQLGDGTTTQRLTPVRVLENVAPIATLTFQGTEASPTVFNINKPIITWNQSDTAALTVFKQFQVEVRDSGGTLVVDSGIVTQANSNTVGSWAVITALPANQVLQVRVRVKDEAVWSEWSPTSWIKVTNAPGGAPLSVSSLTAYVKADGTVWMWGSGVGSTAQQITELSAVVGVATEGYSTLALKSDGTVWMRNYSGTVQQVAGLEGIISVAAGSSSYYALKDDGTVWAWGSNNRGQLGDGTTMDRTTPVKITSLSGVTAIAASNSPTSTIKFAYALKSDGTVWAWGDNSKYQLGDGTNAQRLKPVQVSGLTDVTAISAGSSHGLALKADGSVWTWGYNGLATNRTAVSANVTGVTAIAAGNNSNLVLKTDGTVWAWGENGNGQLGDGTTVNRSTPVQVVGLTDVIHVAASGRHTYNSAALKSDGTVWTWGYNGSGQLGDGTTTQRLTPVRVLGI